ncbi:male accessory gland serine protease inhibitor-like [Drosophila sulfurigaster albostrigata]|uniref:male accessory gland serine protease inhibitor-like n=1 Tax=Drosophila sulfurigaster albostrigata TaxID=89887 RepID=UPI002D219E37|nr:male accessory gland serine protease inhibitor-like [Drosophila sulfurigaster albostrigata]
MKCFSFTLFVTLFALVICFNPACYEPHAVTGPCNAAFPMWTYNPVINKCIEFTYGGCHGNANRFDSKIECELNCLIRFPYGQ